MLLSVGFDPKRDVHHVQSQSGLAVSGVRTKNSSRTAVSEPEVRTKNRNSTAVSGSRSESPPVARLLPVRFEPKIVVALLAVSMGFGEPHRNSTAVSGSRE